ncbi:crotonase/enoyl-CoA hydratase family protein [Erythrobacter sp.]|uniref:crotonase/enoyl-CoA hydratase family protein n=1 Tax=Erythrobacter sp. TaxID=1042 RepID=UPI003C75AD34
MTNSVRIERDGPVTLIVIDRPERRNAVDRATASALAEAFRYFENDDEARVAVLAGAGGTFCAGADLKAVAEGQGNRVEPAGDGPMGPSRMALSKPVIAAVDGHAVAGGMELACWCDLRVVEDNAVFGVFCRRWGVPLIDGGTVRLPRIVGDGVALDFILTGRPVSASEALAIGLATRVVPAGEARSAAIALAKEIAAFPQETMLTDRAGVYRGRDLPLETALRRETEEGLKVLETGRNGAQRFASGKGRGGRFDDANE